MPTHRRYVWLAPLLLLPALLCGCCLGAFFLPLLPTLASHAPLIYGGSQANGTISDIQPCGGGTQLSADTTSGGAHFAYGDSVTGVNVHIEYVDSQGHQHVGQTLLCTANTDVMAGQNIAIVYTESDPQDVILARDQGAYQQFATGLGFSAVVLIVYIILVIAFTRRVSRYSAFAASNSSQATPTIYDPALLTEEQQRLEALTDAAVGRENYPTRHIGLKEALMLMHVRHTAPIVDDEFDTRENSHPLRDHLVLAAMLVDLARQGRIAITRRGFWSDAVISVTDATPTDDADLNELLFTIKTASHQTHLRPFYNAYGRRHLAARLIDQLRQSGYMTLHEPQTGRYSPSRRATYNPAIKALARWLTPTGVKRGALVPGADYRYVYPWQFLDTTRTPEEESIFARLQAAIAIGGASDSFTEALVALISAHYLSFNMFPRRFRAAKSIYRFYPAEARRDAAKRVRAIADQAPESWRIVIDLARRVDDHIENPPSG